MRIAYAADLHGNVALYQALFDLAIASTAQVVIVGGDLLPHESRREHSVAAQREFIHATIRPLLSTFHHEHPDVQVFLLAGNDDWAGAIEQLDDLERDELAHPLHARTYPLGTSSLQLAGYACVPPTPFSMKDYERPDDGSQRASSFGQAFVSEGALLRPISTREFYSRPSIAEELQILAQQSDPQQTIYVCHTPPANTPLDLMRNGKHVGSPALRAFIERYQPPLTLHGHIHEAPELSGQYACQIGQSWCINPGRNPQRFHAVTFDSQNIVGTLCHTIFGAMIVNQ